MEAVVEEVVAGQGGAAVATDTAAAAVVEASGWLTTGSVFSTAVWIAIIGTGSLLAALYFLQDRLLYYPTIPGDARTNFLSARRFGLQQVLEEVVITTPDNVRLQAYFIKHSRSTDVPSILYFHGNAGNLSYRLPNIKRLHSSDVGCNVLILSYRGYGKSSGSPSESGLQIDAQAALDWLHAHPEIDPKKIVVFGRSLGGAVGIKLTSKNQDKVAALMVENTFTSIPDMIDIVLPFLTYFKLLSSNKWSSMETIKEITVPILFLCGAKDELVPSHMMKNLYEIVKDSNPDNQFSEFAEGHHMDTFMHPGYYVVVSKWLNKVFGVGPELLLKKKKNKHRHSDDESDDNLSD
eukprot:TRINITY_DN1646_c0_g1_i1.p1 TRINITY_DN1646_c0_g1~~TRINITY_DN1646_c0_g1_i1.p1  ORF type:complete len:357 (-),score=67.90 TRINITY_DN1646_c0_g1_i1:110-1159(-)